MAIEQFSISPQRPVFAGAGTMQALLQAHDWSAFGPGRPEQWPAWLRTAAQLMFDSRLPGFVGLGDDLRLLYNDAYAELIGDRHPAAFGAPVLAHWAQASDDLRGAFDRALGGSAACAEHVKLPLRRAGRVEQARFLFSVSPLRNDEGAVAGVFGMAIDTTAQAGTEQRRQEEFLAKLAHELRNPLAPIGAAAQLLSVAGLDEARVRKSGEVIVRQVGRMTGLIDDLLDVSRVTRGLVALDREALELAAVVDEAVRQAQPLIEARRHRFDLLLPPEAVWVEGDRQRLVQVLAKLLDNAATYTPENGRIALNVEAQPGRVVLTVVDDGIGMAPELLERAFELFVQAERAPDRPQGSLGIGLSIVRSLVELHGGSVRAHSAGPGTGSEFAVTLPRLTREAAGTPAPGAAGDAPAAGLRVMVVDDNVDAAQMLALFIEAAGHAAVIEHQPRRALERVRELRPDVCLLDIGLPELDGNELARRLRAMPEMAPAVLIAVTGYGQSQDRDNAFAAGFDHHFVKPIDTRRLIALLADIARQQHRAHSPPQ